MALSVSYTQMGKASKNEANKKVTIFKLVFGNGALTYATGVQLSQASLGCPNNLESLKVIGHNDGYSYQFDPINLVLHIYQSAGFAAPFVELASGATPAAVTIYVEATGW